MKTRLFKIYLVAILALTGIGARGQQDQPLPLPQEETQAIVDSIVSTYGDWEKVSMSGKLSSPLLPITASVKIYMERDSLLLISVNGPLIGEAGRIEIDTEKAIVVNKLKGKYASMEMEKVESVCPGGLSALQDLLLGRITIIGEGQLTSDSAAGLNLFEVGDGSLMLLPNQDLENAPLVYFYTVDRLTLLLRRFTVLSQDGGGEVNFFYGWSPKNMEINLQSELDGKPVEGTLKLNTPDTAPKPMQRLDLKSKYTQTDIKGVLR